MIGVFPVGPNGQPAGEYLRNPGHGPVRDDFSKLTTPDDWLGWLPGNPGTAIRDQLQHLLAAQDAGSVVNGQGHR